MVFPRCERFSILNVVLDSKHRPHAVQVVCQRNKIESGELTSRGTADCSEMLILQKNQRNLRLHCRRNRQVVWEGPGCVRLERGKLMRRIPLSWVSSRRQHLKPALVYTEVYDLRIESLAGNAELCGRAMGA